MPILQAFYRIILGIPPQYFQAAFSWQPQLGLFFQQRSSQLLETLRYGKNHTRLWWAHSLQTWKNIYWHFILSARCWLATMSRCLLHVVNLLVVLYLRWWCGLWKLVCIWIGLLQVFIVHGLCHVANLLYCLRLPEPRSTKAEPPSVGKLLSLAHFRWGGTFQSNFQKNVWKYLGYFVEKSRSADIIHPS